MKATKALLALLALCTLCTANTFAKEKKTKKMAEHYVFELKDGVTRTHVTFKNHFGITLAGDLYAPKNAPKSGNPAVAVCGPFGSVKEQVSGRYAMEMASRGIIALSFDPSYYGESSGEPRGIHSPDLNTEDFQAAVDYLIMRKEVDAEKVGIIGICGWGGYALNAAAIDTRIKATVISTMYDLSRVYANDYFDQNDNEEARYAKRKALSDQRTQDAKSGTFARSEGFPKTATEEMPQFLKDYIDFYETPRGYHERSIGSNGGWAVQTSTSLQNTRILDYVNEIRNPVLMIHGENAHSRYFAEGAFKKMTDGSKYAANKELVIIPGARHTDLYDNYDFIPFDRLSDFFKANLK